MIFLFFLVPYEIHSGSMEIIDRNKNLFKDGIEIRSEDILITAREAVQTDTSVILKRNVFVKSRKFSLSADYLNYKVPYKILFGSGNIKIWKDDTLKGDSLIFYREKEEGEIIGNLVYTSDSVEIKGQSADFFEDSIIVKGKPKFKSNKIEVESDCTIYTLKDSTYKFLSDVYFKSSKISGSSGKLIYDSRKGVSTFLESPLILEESDSIKGKEIIVYHEKKTLEALNGQVITYTETGRNIVWGDTVWVYYNDENLDSVSVRGKSRGTFIKNEIKSGKSG
jgi:lipopolysaccharide export system protein LptA